MISTNPIDTPVENPVENLVAQNIRRVIYYEKKLKLDSDLHRIGMGWMEKHDMRLPKMPEPLTKKWYRWHAVRNLFMSFNQKIYDKGKTSSFCSKIGAKLLEGDNIYRSLAPLNLKIEDFFKPEDPEPEVYCDLVYEKQRHYIEDDIGSSLFWISGLSLYINIMCILAFFFLIPDYCERVDNYCTSFDQCI